MTCGMNTGKKIFPQVMGSDDDEEGSIVNSLDSH